MAKHGAGWYAGWTAGAVIVIAAIVIAAWFGTRGGNKPATDPKHSIGVGAWTFGPKGGSAGESNHAERTPSNTRATKSLSSLPSSSSLPLQPLSPQHGVRHGSRQAEIQRDSRVSGNRIAGGVGRSTCGPCQEAKLAKKRVTFALP